MSIVTLKKKTDAKYKNSSVNQEKFSINGPTRNQGWVGQNMFHRQQIINDINDLSVSKPSTISSSNLIQKRYHNTPKYLYFKDTNMISHQSYIDKKKKNIPFVPNNLNCSAISVKDIHTMSQSDYLLKKLTKCTQIELNV